MKEYWLEIIIGIASLILITKILKSLSDRRKIKKLIFMDTNFSKAFRTKDYHDISQIGYQVYNQLQSTNINKKKLLKKIEKELQTFYGTNLQKARLYLTRFIQYLSLTICSLVMFAVLISIFASTEEQNKVVTSKDDSKITESKETEHKTAPNDPVKVEQKSTKKVEVVQPKTQPEFYYNEYGAMIFPREDYSSLSFPLDEETIMDYLFESGFIPKGYSVMYEGVEGEHHIYRIFEDMETHIVTYDWFEVNMNTGEAFSVNNTFN